VKQFGEEHEAAALQENTLGTIDDNGIFLAAPQSCYETAGRSGPSMKRLWSHSLLDGLVRRRRV